MTYGDIMKQKYQGFTLIEMIGVLAIIAILVGAVAPRIFEAIQESKANNIASLHKTVQTATTKYFADVNTLGTTNRTNGNMNMSYSRVDANNNNSFSALLTHTKIAANNGNDWKKFRGPYLDEFVQASPPTGEAMGLDISTGDGTLSNSTNTDFDLQFTGTGSISSGDHIVSLRIEEITNSMYEKVDAIIDGSQGTDPTTAGKVKYDGTNLIIFVASE
tara:strand:- start:1380 stop:2033 length:654 start_codon:yes stop_codon:yes gene_type:complete